MEFDNRILLVFVVAVALILFFSPTESRTLSSSKAYAEPAVLKKHPNIVLFLVDNEPNIALGTYGGGLGVQTPNVDQFAKEGIKFTRAFATNGYCSPTRASLYTGLMPSQTGVHDALHDDVRLFPNHWSVVQDFRTISQSLADRGYDTALTGKFHLGSPWIPQLGFNYWVTFPFGWTENYYNNTIIDNGKIYQICCTKHLVDFMTQKAIDYIGNRTQSSKPFFLTVALDGPYLDPPSSLGPDPKNRFFNYYWHQHDFSKWPREGINENILGQVTGSIPSYADKFGMGNFVEQMRQMNDAQSLANMQAQIKIVDDNFGKFLTALKKDGLDNNTLVLYTSDQANFIGNHGRFGHAAYTIPSTLQEEATVKVPFLARQPGVTPSNVTTDMLTSEYDVPATIMDYAGFPGVTFDHSPGHSFAAFLKTGKPIANWTKTVYYEQGETRGVSTKDYALWKRVNATNLNQGNDTINETPSGYGYFGVVKPKFWVNELFDLRADPHQTVNLYNDPKYSQVQKALDTNLTQFFEKYSDPKYDLWKGGTAKAYLVRAQMWKQIWGPKWPGVIVLNGATAPRFHEANMSKPYLPPTVYNIPKSLLEQYNKAHNIAFKIWGAR